MKEIVLADGQITQVDDIDFDLNQYSWYSSHGYVARCVGGRLNKQEIYMANVITERMGLIGEIDHKDRNKLNNQRLNLRISMHSQNCCNRSVQSNNKSGYKGVSWHKRRNKYRAVIKAGGVQLELGYYNSVIEAARAYDAAAKRWHKEFAVLNFPEESTNGAN